MGIKIIVFWLLSNPLLDHEDITRDMK